MRRTFSAFILSAAVMSISLFSLLIFVGGNDGIHEAGVFSPTKLEPFAEPIDGSTAPAVLELEEQGVSDEALEALLASAINEAVPDEIYSVRVAFAAVLINRTENDAFPSSLGAVIRSAGLYPVTEEKNLPERTLHAARDALLGVDPTGGALYAMRTDDDRYSEFKSRTTAIYGNYAFIK